MNHLDDELIDGLRSGLAHRIHGVHAPAGMAVDARRVARRRSATRAVGAGVPVLAVAGLATMLLTGSGGGRARPGIAPPAAGTSVVTPVARVQDTAYIVKRVKARVADRAGAVIDSLDYARGHMSSDGTLSGLGSEVAGGPSYTAPDGTASTKTVQFYRDGSPALIMFRVFVPDRDGSGRGDQTNTTVNYRTHIYSRAVFDGVSNDPGQRTAGLNLYATPAEVQQALQDGEVTQTGTTSVDGTPAIALSVKVPSAPGARLILYVDAHTDQPLRSAEADQGFSGVTVNEWMPATADNIAMSRPPILADYTRVKAPTYTPPGNYTYNGGSGPLQEADTGSGH